MSIDAVTIQVDERQFKSAMDTIRRLQKALPEKKVKQIHARNLRPTAAAMKSATKSTRLAKMIGVTTTNRKSPPYGARVGVIRNDAKLFPKFSSYSTARLIEYGSAGERFRKIKRGSLVTGRQSTGIMPASPALRPAWDNTREAYIKNTERDLVNEVQKEANK